MSEAAPTAAPRPGGLRPAFLAAIVALTLLAWAQRFIQDDAFISFRYARHLVEGHGFVWNVGEAPIQGFSNPLWTLVMALGLRFGADPVAFAQALGLACFAGTLLTSGLLAIELTGAPRLGLAAMVWLGLNASLSAFATGGLETQSQAMLVVVVALFVARGLRASAPLRPFAIASTAAGLAFWTRMDSALFVGPLLGAALLGALRSESAARPNRAAVVAVVAPAGVLAASLLAFQWIVFRSLVPNTFAAKTGGVDPLLVKSGVDYVLSFFAHYQLLPVVAVALFAARGGVSSPRPFVVAVLVALAAWGLYVAGVGGDFMEYRLLVPALPLLVVLLVSALSSLGERLVWFAVVAGACASAYFFAHARHSPVLGEGAVVETVRGLDAHVTDPEQNWPEVGRGLRRAFACYPDVTVAVMAAGAVPYYSGLRTVDMLGLSDAWVARHGVVYGPRPGHRRGATLPYLVAKRVNLVVHPWGRSDPDRFATDYTRLAVVSRYVPLSLPDWLPPGAEIVEIPIAEGRMLRALYLVRDAGVDRCIAEGKWRTLPIRP